MRRCMINETGLGIKIASTTRLAQPAAGTAAPLARF
jgi:hypothetical protein